MKPLCDLQDLNLTMFQQKYTPTLKHKLYKIWRNEITLNDKLNFKFCTCCTKYKLNW